MTGMSLYDIFLISQRKGVHIEYERDRSQPEEKRHTIEEYYALPEDQRVELIDGVIPSGSTNTYGKIVTANRLTHRVL